MQESLSDLIHVGINFGFALFFFGVVCGLVSCIINCYKNNDNHDHEHSSNSDDHVIITIKECGGVKPSVLRSISVVEFKSKDFKNSVECVVCLSDFVDGDKAKVLPSCNHWFHADCIDSWIRLHSTCPICRTRVGSVQRGTRPELGGDESLAQNNDLSPELVGLPTDFPPSTNAAVVE